MCVCVLVVWPNRTESTTQLNAQRERGGGKIVCGAGYKMGTVVEELFAKQIRPTVGTARPDRTAVPWVDFD